MLEEWYGDGLDGHRGDEAGEDFPNNDGPHSTVGLGDEEGAASTEKAPGEGMSAARQDVVQEVREGFSEGVIVFEEYSEGGE